MNILIYLIISLLFIVLIFWTWNNTKEFEQTKQRISFVIIGILVITIITLVFFYISKIGIIYPKPEMIKNVRKMIMLLFIPINGFFSLPHIGAIKTDIALRATENEKIKKKIIILGIIFVVVTVIEINYMKDFQNGIIQMLNKK